jgi:hypothetical protein
MSGIANTFEIKLKLFSKHLENSILCHFSSCDLLHNDGSVFIPFPSAQAVEMIDSLAKNLKRRFKNFCSHTINIFDDHILLKKVMLHKNCNLIWMNCIMIQFCAVVSTMKLHLLCIFTSILAL